MKKFLVIGPDGVADRPEPYDTIEQAQAAIQEFAERYAPQGYYATASGIPIPVSMIPDCCDIEEITEP